MDNTPFAETELPPGTKKDVAQVDSSLATSISLWLRRRGKAVRPKLSAEQKQQLKECFELMDQDGSGAIDADELGAAFKLLGIRMKKSEIEELLAEVDHDGSGEVEYLEFLEIMTTTLQRLAEEREADEAHAGEGQVPFALMATAYRRKRLMEGIISGDKEVMTQIAQLSEKQTQEAAAAAEAQAHRRAKALSTDPKKVISSITKRSLQRLVDMHVDEELLAELTPEERRLLSSVAAKAQSSTSRQGGGSAAASLPPAGAAAAMARRGGSPPGPSGQSAPQVMAPGLGPGLTGGKSGVSATRLPTVNSRYMHYTQTATHRQLMEVPQVLDIKFSRSTVKLPSGASRASVTSLKSVGSSGGLPQLAPNRSNTMGQMASFTSEASQYHRGTSAAL